jgi:alpha-D-ribose 1-methylphosphonate 5-triphosphate synthase subunit PhnH
MEIPPAAGFADPVFEAQAAFRRILDALSQPGRIEDLGGTLAPPGLTPAAATILLTLADYETPLWLPPILGQPTAAWLTFHTSAPLAATPLQARFAVLTGAQGEPALSAFAAGDDLYPDRSATVLMQCAGLEGGMPVTLAGPGIADTRIVAPRGLPAGFWRQLAQSNRRYPRGIDVLLVSGTRLIGLPRSLVITTTAEAI